MQRLWSFSWKFLTLPRHKLYYGLGTTAGFPKLWRTAEPASILRKYSTSAPLRQLKIDKQARNCIFSGGMYYLEDKFLAVEKFCLKTLTVDQRSKWDLPDSSKCCFRYTIREHVPFHSPTSVAHQRWCLRKVYFCVYLREIYNHVYSKW